MDEELKNKLAEYGFDEELNRPSYSDFMKAKQKEWLKEGQTLFCSDDDDNLRPYCVEGVEGKKGLMRIVVC